MAIPFFFFLRSSDKKDLLYGGNTLLGLLSLICLHEKAYYLAMTILLQIVLLNKLTNSLLINLKPKSDTIRGKKKKFLIAGYFLFGFTIICMILFLNTPVSEMNISLSFHNSDIYRLLILFLAFLLVFITRKESKK